MSHLLFLPDPQRPRFFLWGGADGAGEVSSATALRQRGEPGRARVLDEALAVREVEGTAIALLEALPLLAALDADELARAPASLVAWSLAAKLALDLLARERIVPRVVRGAGASSARWAIALLAREDAERVAALARAMPPAAHAVPVEDQASRPRLAVGTARGARQAARSPCLVWSPDAILRAFLDAAADAIVRAAAGSAQSSGRGPASGRAQSPGRGPAVRRAKGKSDSAARAPWEERFAAALCSGDPAFEPAGFRERTLLDELDAWALPARGAEAGAPRVCFRLELAACAEPLIAPPRQREAVRGPAAASAPRQRGGAQRPAPAAEPPRHVDARERATVPERAFALAYFLQASDDPSLLVPAEAVWQARGTRLRHLGRSFGAPQEHLLRALASASRLFAPITRSLAEARPERLALDASEAWVFLEVGAPALTEAGHAVVLPAELTRSGRRRLNLRMRVGAGVKTAGVVQGASCFGQDEIFSFRWEAALGGETLTAAEFEALAALKAPLVRWRGEWVAVDPAELAQAKDLLGKPLGQLSAAQALSLALSGSTDRAGGTPAVEVAAEGRLAALLERLRAGAERTVAVPGTFRGTLRPYQERGLAWLATMADLGLGGCLADDMGLGKTIQVLAFLLHRREARPDDRRPILLVCPTSVVGNWEREIARFAPALAVVRHYGPERERSAARLAAQAQAAIVLTSYGLLRRDAELLTAVEWSVAVLDEAQNVKNAASRGARAARALRAGERFALTGTPVENRLSELWSILEFTTPGLLGPLEPFRRAFALPIERWRDEAVAGRLSRIVRPFLLRRMKSDPNVIRDLPPKNEMTVVCSLTREQATLYQAAVDEALERIESSEGLARRGRVLALLTALKQICNHPAQYLGESGPLERRSGKLTRLAEMLEECLAEGDRALVFTQFREMGNRLVAHLSRTLAIEVPFLHGGTARAARDEMVRRFQEEQQGPRVFVLSLKAGGTGLNLTAANRVFHFDRWWNPAVEDQATDRAWRIGQKRAVLVHKLSSAGTVEEKIERLLTEKRALAARVVGAGEGWITELGDRELRELFALSRDAAVDAEEEAAEADDAAELLVVGPAVRTRAARRRPSGPGSARRRGP